MKLAKKKTSSSRIAALESENEKLRSSLLFMSEALVMCHKEMESLIVKFGKDPVTDLFRRSEHAEHEIAALISLAQRNEQSVALLLLDLDYLKQINDLRGHDVGDEALRIVSKITMECLRKNDLVYRWGGDEILVLTTFDSNGIDPLAVEKFIIKKIKDCLNETDFEQTNKVSLNISAGYAVQKKEEPFEKLFKRADKNLYENKKERPPFLFS